MSSHQMKAASTPKAATFSSPSWPWQKAGILSFLILFIHLFIHSFIYFFLYRPQSRCGHLYHRVFREMLPAGSSKLRLGSAGCSSSQGHPKSLIWALLDKKSKKNLQPELT